MTHAPQRPAALSARGYEVWKELIGCAEIRATLSSAPKGKVAQYCNTTAIYREKINQAISETNEQHRKSAAYECRVLVARILRLSRQIGLK
jgi:phage terminase small subunit